MINISPFSRRRSNLVKVSVLGLEYFDEPNPAGQILNEADIERPSPARVCILAGAGKRAAIGSSPISYAPSESQDFGSARRANAAWTWAVGRVISVISQRRFGSSLKHRFAVLPHSRFIDDGMTFTTLMSFPRLWSTAAKGLIWPYLELAMRLWIARLFFFFGVQQLMHWQITQQVADQQNPIPVLTPLVAAYFSTSVYLLSSVLLAVGLATRYASPPLFALAIIAQIRIEPFDGATGRRDPAAPAALSGGAAAHNKTLMPQGLKSFAFLYE